MEQKYNILNQPVVCSACGLVYYRKSYEEPLEWFKIAVIGPRCKPFKEWYACSKGCFDIVVRKARDFLAESLEE